jgi:hypothetical protein
MEENQSDGISEPTPSSMPPPDVHIPIESIYGNNTPIATQATPQSISPTQNIPPNSNVIRIGLIPLIAIILCLLGGAIAIPLVLVRHTEEKTTSPISIQSSTTEKHGNPVKNDQKTGFTPDQGIYKRENKLDYKELARTRINLAKTRIIWITDTPDNLGILPSLAAKKNRDPVPIFILTGKETRPERLQNAAAYDIPISQLGIEFESPYSFLFIDDKLFVDVSRNHWLWESKEPRILEEAKKWIQTIIEEQTQK